ncbi:MAG: hypothetical protein L6Q54_13835 [Leptospiraceae bacterium]|nr:hypothetical protein [Leptospiraceae bacterium]MCK6382315.1 hypothetical protein [Leptospiraceae bacterium]NUM41028.1 hypothetical protein [Leptospiraceae bacterium]
MSYLKFILFILFLVHCNSTTLLTKQDYAVSKNLISSGEVLATLKYFPEHKEKDFITTMEKTYLQLLNGIPSIDELIKYSKKIETRLRFSATRELKSFFYLETPEGYYASEHEVIWMHILLSWGYSLKKDFEKAAIEARKTASLLNGQWSEEGRFDDPMLRIVLGAMWAMCGHWEEAKVDFRVASNLSPNLRWARELSELDSPPTKLVLVLAGTGPEILWNPKLDINPLRSARGIEFKQNGKKSVLKIKDFEGNVFKSGISTDSSNWYKRHFLRENAIQDAINDSKYGQKMFITASISSAKIAAGITVGIITGTLSVALGGALIYAGLQIGSDVGGTIAGLGLATGIGGVNWSYNYAKDTTNDALNEAKENLDSSNTYRFVRFLPEYVWIGWSKKEISYPIYGISKKETVFSIFSPLQTQNESNPVSITFFPDVK